MPPNPPKLIFEPKLQAGHIFHFWFFPPLSSNCTTGFPFRSQSCCTSSTFPQNERSLYRSFPHSSRVQISPRLIPRGFTWTCTSLSLDSLGTSSANPVDSLNMQYLSSFFEIFLRQNCWFGPPWQSQMITLFFTSFFSGISNDVISNAILSYSAGIILYAT